MVTADMEAVSVLQTVAALLVGLLVLRTATALLSHYFPDTAAAQAAHYIVG